MDRSEDVGDIPKMKKPARKWEFKMPERFQNLDDPNHPDYSPEGPGLPERPHRRIKEKFRLDLERIEANLNAKGDSLYRSKLKQMQANAQGQQDGYGQPDGYGPPVGYAQPGFNYNPFGWGGGFPSTRERTGPPGWGGGPHTPREQERELEQSLMDSPDAKGFREFRDSFQRRSPGDDPFSKEDFVVDDEEGSPEEAFGDQGPSVENDFEAGDEPNPFGVGDLDGQDNSVELHEGGQEKFEDEEDEFGMGPLHLHNEFTYRNSFGETSEEAAGGSQEVMMTNTAADVSAKGTAVTEMEGSPQTELEPHKRRRQLKEKFMKENEELEKMMNAKGDSMYRKAGDPIPEHLKANLPEGYGQRGRYPGERRFQTTEELRAQMALQKIARAAMKVHAKRGKKRGTPVIFI